MENKDIKVLDVVEEVNNDIVEEKIDMVEEKIDIDIEYNSTVIKEEVIVENEAVVKQEIKAENITPNPLLKGIIRVYQNNIPWSNRNNATILSLGKVLGVDYFIHPLKDLAIGIPKDTKVILISSNSSGRKISAEEENLPLAQSNLECFVRCGGVLIVDMADNLSDGGYIAPGSHGTPDYIFTNEDETNKLFLTKESYCTSFVNGPTITLNKDNVSMGTGFRYSAHGNLVDGITIPKRSEILMTAPFGDCHKPVLAYYYLGKGFVIVDTITKEYYGQAPVGNGPSNIITNLIYFAYHLSEIKCKY